MINDRYGTDVLAPGWQRREQIKSVKTPAVLGLVVEDKLTGWCGEITRCENGIVVLTDRHNKNRSFPLGAGFLIYGKPVELVSPPRARAGGQKNESKYTPSGSLKGAANEPAKVALPSRIYVEGKHDAQLVEKIWGDDLRHVGVVVEFLEGIDRLADQITQFQPNAARRLGILVDHLVPGSKESQIAAQLMAGEYGEYILITGHEYVDIWAAVKPQLFGLSAWPEISREIDWKVGICTHLGWPAGDHADLADAWRRILAKVTSWQDLDRQFVVEVEKLIDFVGG